MSSEYRYDDIFHDDFSKPTDIIVNGRVLDHSGGVLTISFIDPGEDYKPCSGLSLQDELFFNTMTGVGDLFTTINAQKRNLQLYPELPNDVSARQRKNGDIYLKDLKTNVGMSLFATPERYNLAKLFHNDLSTKGDNGLFLGLSLHGDNTQQNKTKLHDHYFGTDGDVIKLDEVVVHAYKIEENNWQLFSMLDRLEKLANNFTPNRHRSRELVFQYIRRNVYKGGLWPEVAGDIDEDFATYVHQHDREIEQFFVQDSYIIDPATGHRIDFYHYAATLNALLYDSSSLKSRLAGEKTVDDLAGWAGDFQTLINNVAEKVTNPHDYAECYRKASLLFGSVEYSFSFSDLLADVDAANIVSMMSFSPHSVGYIFREYYNEKGDSGYKRRYRDFTEYIVGHKPKSKEELNRAIVKYARTHYIWPKRYPLIENNPTNTLFLAVRDYFTDYIWEQMQKEQ